METIRELLISLGLDVETAKFVEAIGLEHLLEKGAELLVEALKEIPKAIAEVVASTAEYGNEINDIAERTGLTTDAVQQLGFIAGVTGESIQNVEISINHLARSMAAARDGSDEAVKAFGKLGVRVTDAHGKLRPLDDVFNDLSGGFARLPKGAERSAVALAVLGRGGTKMLNVLGQGPEAVAALRKEFEELGAGMDQDAIERADELNKSFNKLGMVFAAFKRELAGPLIEALGPIVEGMLEWVKANRELIRSRIAELGRLLVTVFRGLLKVFAGFGKVIAFVVDNLKGLALILGGVVLAAIVANLSAVAGLVVAYVTAGAAAVVAGLAAAASWIAAAAPVLLLAALFAALLLILDDVRGYLEGEESLLGHIGPMWTKFLDDFSKPRSGDPWWLAALRQATYFVTHLYESIPALLDRVEGFVRAVDIGPFGRLDSYVRDKVVGAFSGGASGPEAAAASSVGAGRTIATGDVNATIEIHPPPGSSAEAIASATADQLDEWHARKLREAAAAVGE